MQAGPETVAAFIAEPVAGATLAAAVPCDEYWPAMAEVCRRHGVLVIADEVMTGFGRTGRWFGVDHWGVRPDIVDGRQGHRRAATCRSGSRRRAGEVFETVAAQGFVARVHVVAQRAGGGGRRARRCGGCATDGLVEREPRRWASGCSKRPHGGARRRARPWATSAASG